MRLADAEIHRGPAARIQNGRQIYQQRGISCGAAILNRGDAADAGVFDAEPDVLRESDTERAAGAERRRAGAADSECEEASTSTENCKQTPGGAHTREADCVAS